MLLPSGNDSTMNMARSSNLEYVRASNDITNLKKDEKTTINDHINKFEQLVYEVNYNKLSDTKNMEESVVNLKFLNTLMVDKASSDKWETFINAKGPQLETMSTQQLYAEVRVTAARIPSKPTLERDGHEIIKALNTSVDLYQAIKDLNNRIDNLQRSNGNGVNGTSNNGVRKLMQPASEDNTPCIGCKDPNHNIESCPLSCVWCKENGYLIDDCLKLRWVNEQRHSRPRDDDDNWRELLSKRPRKDWPG